MSHTPIRFEPSDSARGFQLSCFLAFLSPSLLTVHADEARIHKLVGPIRSNELNKPFSSMR
jgi:hypothetical protein